jgi:2-polyprenyl-6-methoxyphenol hydroxylase-like FAD-dependent oxidoreductase
MLVCRMQHELEHQQVAWEWFGYGQTLALLPLNGRQSSTVLTLPPREIERLQNLDEASFAREMEQRFDRRLGAMQLVSSRHAYPLVGAYARRMVGSRCALLGDAAVGMHPVTAHGFNFGLIGVQLLSDAPARGPWQTPGHRCAGSAGPLRTPATCGHLAAVPGTNLLVELYTNDQLPARLLRGAGLRVAQGLLPLKKGIARHLTAQA